MAEEVKRKHHPLRIGYLFCASALRLQTQCLNKRCHDLAFAFYFERQTITRAGKFYLNTRSAPNIYRGWPRCQKRSLTSSLLPSGSPRTKFVPLIRWSQRVSAWTLWSIQLWRTRKKGQIASDLLYIALRYYGPENCRQSSAQSFPAKTTRSSTGIMVYSRFGDRVTRLCYFQRDNQIRLGDLS